jgi:hypothetical protein
MRRREFITFIGCAAAWPIATFAHGQQVLNQMQDRHCHAYGKQDDRNSHGN